jgi:hypothetical protein
MKKLVLLILVFVFISFGFMDAMAQKFHASVSRNPVSEGQTFQVTFSLEDASGKGFQAPGFKGFTVLTGPSTSQSTRIINGNMSSSVSYTYLLKADNIGQFTIGSASITVDGKKLRTDPIQVQVVKASARQSQQSSSQDDAKSLEEQAYDIISDNAFVRLSVSKSTVSENEQFVATYKLYIDPELNLVDLSAPKMPTFNGFWTTELDIGQVSFRSETYNGKAYKVADLKKVILLPQQTGQLKIEPMEVELIVRLRVQSQSRSRQGFFDDPFFGDPFGRNFRDFPYTAKTNSPTINVKSLPSDAPAEFQGAVGDFTMKAWMDKQNTKTNDPVTLKVQINGKGNLKLIQPLPLNLPQDIENYEPKINDNISTTTSGMSGSRTFEYLLLPRNPGTYKIDPVRFAYFDINSGQYKVLSSDEFELNVEKGSGSASSPVITGVRKEDVQLLGKDIRFIKSAPEDFKRSGDKFFGSTWFYILNISPALLFVFLYAYRRKQEKESGNLALMKQKKANRLAKKRLSSAKNFMNKDENKFYEETSKALWGYVSDKLSIPYSDLTSEKAEEKLRQANVPEGILKKLTETIDYCESARFAPASEKISQQDLYNNAASVITDMEGSIK